MQITHHTELLNALIEKYNLKSYLEIGVQNPANNFDKIRCESKIGADPETDDPLVYKMTSDNFFTYIKSVPLSFDLIFIDGLHHADQVKRDFENSLRCLSDNGFIVIHDVLPENEEGTLVPRQTKKWWGDVYKFAMTMREYVGVRYKTFNIDEGCMLVWKSRSPMPLSTITLLPENPWLCYEYYGKELMNVTDEVTI